MTMLASLSHRTDEELVQAAQAGESPAFDELVRRYRLPTLTGAAAGGRYALFIDDVNPGDVGTLRAWSVELTVAPAAAE